MPNRRILIIDDNKHERDYLKSVFKKPEFSEFEVIGEAETTAEGRLLIKKLKPEGVFLDIHIQTEGKEAGLNLAVELNKMANRPWIIFITGNPKDYSSKITEMNIYNEGFINKLCDGKDVAECIEWIKRKYPIYNRRVEVNYYHSLTTRIFPKEIVYVQKNTNKNTTKMHLVDNCINLDEIHHTIEYWRCELMPYNIIRIQNSFLVNLHHIASYDKVKKLVYVKCCMEPLHIGRAFIDDFIQAYNNL